MFKMVEILYKEGSSFVLLLNNCFYNIKMMPPEFVPLSSSKLMLPSRLTAFKLDHEEKFPRKLFLRESSSAPKDGHREHSLKNKIRFKKMVVRKMSECKDNRK